MTSDIIPPTPAINSKKLHDSSDPIIPSIIKKTEATIQIIIFKEFFMILC